MELRMLRILAGDSSCLAERRARSTISTAINRSCRTTLSGGVAVLHKCANPVCGAQFRYLYQGRLFEVETQYFESESGNGRGKPRNGKGHIERYWLCDQCAVHIALRFDRGRGLVMVSSLEDFEEVVTTTVPQSGPKATTQVARVLIRPFKHKQEL